MSWMSGFSIAELGHYALVLALALSLIQSTVPLWGASARDNRLMRVGTVSTLIGFLYVTFAFGALTVAYINSDFSVANVWENSHSAKPLLFKISGVWGNHEGSMMLWVLILSLFGALVAAFGGNLPVTLKARVLAVQGWVATAFLLFILTTSNPFLRLTPAPGEGRDLNPILQDVGLAIHPPLLYLGYVGFSIVFSFAAAALIEGRVDAAWARWVRPWTLMAWIFLTLGIAMGSYWAYYELGWGGWWFWDPVENASFMPWLAGTALLHSAIVMEKRGALKIWTILLAILTFSLSLLGTFLVRSGVLTSVHAFATDPTRGVFILAILVLFIGGSLALFAWRAPELKQGGLFAPISREGALLYNNLFLVAATATVFAGTLYPLVLEALTKDKISVGAPFYNITFAPLMVPLLLAVPFGPMLAWKRGDLAAAAQRLLFAMVLAVVALVATLIIEGVQHPLAPLGIGLGIWLIAGAANEIIDRSGIGRMPLKTSWARFTGMPRTAFATALAHAGLGVTVIGIVATTTYQTETIVSVKPGESLETGGYTLTYQDSVPHTENNYREELYRFVVSRDGEALLAIAPAKRFYSTRQMSTTEAAIKTFWFSQLYVSIGDQHDDGSLTVRAYYKPLVTFIWLGAVLMAIGGTVSLSDRRFRIGVAKPARAKRLQEAKA
ncbi:cytochrome c-type biogenesis protein CcmF [Afifella marina DSM 2698]|uniref:Cytochrome c-type biogenesis protein CcmF n=4 Tax=Afifella marina TaxID=1080 RepID=A0A1G5MJ23_AFIMA|nr:heme lyase CcmF/NrfE family subunit [Afifella marina]SCZ24380.1 cytochrome c-type biogenesis protein CcmF [Afifella marina DSM 2698]